MKNKKLIFDDLIKASIALNDTSHRDPVRWSAALEIFLQAERAFNGPASYADSPRERAERYIINSR